VQAFRTAQLRALVRAGTSLLDQVLAPTGVGVAFLDGAGRVLGATPAGEEMLGELAAGELAAAVQGDRHPSGAPGGDPVAQLQRRLAGAADRFDGRDRGRDPILVRYVTGLGGELDAMVMDRRHTDDLGRLQALGLTPREAEVLLHAVDGRTVAETASRLGSRPGTVRKHLERIYAKLGVSSRGAAVAQAVDALMWRPELGAPLDAQASQTPNRFRKATVVEPTSSPMDSRTAVGEGSDANRGD
jgi:DNA-binding CsgD family transcriptional regulator